MDYKRVFNEEYEEYLKLKESIDLAFTRHHQEYASLRDKIKSAPKHSEEARVGHISRPFVIRHSKSN